MQPNFYWSPLAVSLAMVVASPAKAAEPVALQHESFKNLQQQFQLVLPGVKQAVKKSLSNALLFVKQHTDKNQITHIRMQQEYAGFPVYGGYAIIHSQNTAGNLLAQGKVAMTGVIYRGLSDELGLPDVDFIKNADAALQAFKRPYQDKMLSEEKVIPLIYIDEDKNAHWAYKVSVDIHYNDKIPERPTAIIDATTYKPFVRWNDIKTATRTAVNGMGYGGNAKVGEYTFGINYPLLEITRDSKQEICYMENESVQVINMEHRYSSPNKPMQFACKENLRLGSLTFWTGYKGDGYDKDNGAFSPSNDALYAGYVIKHLYQDWYGVEVLTTRQGKPMQLVMRVHYGRKYENAFWDGQRMTFGDGDSMMYPLVSLGIGAHEISHGFTEQHSNLEYKGQSGGINESFSDMAAQAAEYYSTGESSWLIGAEVMKEKSGWEALRYMDKPSRDGVSIDSADKYYRGLDVHYSSGVYNHLFYLLSNTAGWNPRKAFDVMVKANMDYWTPYATFKEAGCGIMNATYDLGLPIDDIKRSLAGVAVDYKACKLITPKILV